MSLEQVGSTEWQRLTTDTPVRSAVRFPLKIPVLLRTASGQRDAITEDVSANGLLFRGRNLPQVDSEIEFTMRMPGAIMGSAGDVLIHCIGRIVRHQRQSSDDLAAAVIDEYFLKA